MKNFKFDIDSLRDVLIDVSFVLVILIFVVMLSLLIIVSARELVSGDTPTESSTNTSLQYDGPAWHSVATEDTIFNENKITFTNKNTTVTCTNFILEVD